MMMSLTERSSLVVVQLLCTGKRQVATRPQGDAGAGWPGGVGRTASVCNLPVSTKPLACRAIGKVLWELKTKVRAL